MILKNISIINFKNIKSANLELSPKINCLIGHNGMGKTNFLDAIYYLSFCRSAYNSIDSQIITHDEPFFMLEGNYDNDKGEIENVYCGMKRGTKKHFKRNKKEYKRLSQHIGLIPLILVSPSDVSLIEGGSEERRKLMDVVISQYDYSYIEALSNYNKALQQRNALLKMEEEPDITLLELWEQQMASNGELLYRKRQAFVDELVPLFQQIYQQISGDKEQVRLHYVSQFTFLQRTSSNTLPLLLLDDIFDKLDAQRVEAIVKLVAGDHFGQIFITDTNRDHLDKILQNMQGDHTIFYVENGEIIK